MRNTRPTANGKSTSNPEPMISIVSSPNGRKRTCPVSWTAMLRYTKIGVWSFCTSANQPHTAIRSRAPTAL